MADGDTPPLLERRLRIAICHPDLGIGGAERLVVDAALELKARGHHVHVFTAHHDKSRCFKETIDGSFPVSVYGSFLPRHILHRFHAVCAYLRCLYVALAMSLWWASFDVVLVDQVAAVIPILRTVPGTKVLFYCHFPDMLLAQRSSRLRELYRAPIDWLEQTTTGMADKIVVNSDFTAAVFASTFTQLASRGLVPAVLYPAVDTLHPDARLAKSPSRGGSSSGRPSQWVAGIQGLPSDSRFFLSINRFERKKNIGLAIRAFAQLRARKARATLEAGGSPPGPDPPSSSNLIREVRSELEGVYLVIAGGYDRRLAENREYLEELRGVAEEEGVAEAVLFVPSFSDEQKTALLTGCICVLYTPENEHFGIVPLEAMAARKAVIACNSGGPKESVQHSSTGFLCEPTPQSFAAAMDSLISQPSRAEVMGRAARRHVEANFSRTVFGDRLNEIVFKMVREVKR